MDRIWQWAWDRYGQWYSWVIWLISFANLLLSYLIVSFLVVVYEMSIRYVESAIVTVAAWVGISMVASAFTFTFVGVMVGAVLDPNGEVPALAVAIAGAMTVGIGVPLALGAMTSAGLRPIRDFAEATQRVGAGDYSQ